MAISELYANTGATGFTINFFMNAGTHPRSGYLAAPFFTTNDPIKALTDKGCDVRLIIRFSPITTPQALRQAFENPRVKTRYFTDSKFHTKLYIIDEIALVGSANLTHDGLQENRELSVLLKQDRDDAFNALRGLFDELWNDANVLNEEVLRKYEKAFKHKEKPQDENAFEKFIHNFVKPAAPPRVSSLVAKRNQKSVLSFKGFAESMMKFWCLRIMKSSKLPNGTALGDRNMLVRIPRLRWEGFSDGCV